MPAATLKLIESCAEFIPGKRWSQVPHKTRGIYVLYQLDKGKYDVVYVGMAGAANAGIRGRLKSHFESKSKKGVWSHFSYYQVWDNISEEEVRELEGIIRHIFRKDSHANLLATQKAFGKLRKVRNKKLER